MGTLQFLKLLIDEFENEHSNTASGKRCWDKFKFIAG